MDISITLASAYSVTWPKLFVLIQLKLLSQKQKQKTEYIVTLTLDAAWQFPGTFTYIISSYSQNNL